MLIIVNQNNIKRDKIYSHSTRNLIIRITTVQKIKKVGGGEQRKEKG